MFLDILNGGKKIRTNCCRPPRGAVSWNMIGVDTGKSWLMSAAMRVVSWNISATYDIKSGIGRPCEGVSWNACSISIGCRVPGRLARGRELKLYSCGNSSSEYCQLSCETASWNIIFSNSVWFIRVALMRGCEWKWWYVRLLTCGQEAGSFAGCELKGKRGNGRYAGDCQPHVGWELKKQRRDHSLWWHSQLLRGAANCIAASQKGGSWRPALFS